VSVDLRTAWRLFRTRPLAELPARVGRFVRREARAAGRRRDFRRGAFRVDDSELARSLVSGVDAGGPLSFRLGVAPLDAGGRARFAEEFRRDFPEAAAAIVAAADDACAHRFDILGSGPVELGAEIDWHRDFKSGFRWAPDYCGDLVLVDLSNDADVKVPWELSRGQHLVTLGQAFWLTGEERYASEVAAQLGSWISANPAWGSVNWGNAMEAAIRVANWLWAASLVRDAAAFGPDERRRLRGSALEHGRFIRENLEVIAGQPASNHYVSDLVGLVYLGVLMPELREAASWRAEGLARLLHELPRQVREDGVDYECSTSYHRLVAELYVSAFAVSRQGGVTVPGDAWDRVGRMIEFTRHYTRPDGRAPLLGDADDGRLHGLTPAPPDDHRPLLAQAGALWGRPEWLAAAGDRRAEAAWWCGVEAAGEAGPAPEVASRGFAAGGVYVLRHRDDYAIVDGAGPAEITGHAHNDTLGFELCAGGRAFIVDSGTFAYTASAEARNRFRGTAAHNVVMIDGAEMNTIPPDDLFSLGREARVRVLRWESSAERDGLEAEHDGYTRLVGAPVHRRTFTFDKAGRRWRLEDVVTGSGRHTVRAFLHLDAGVELDRAGDTEWRARADGRELRITCLHPLRPRRDFVSRSYGRRSEAWVLEMELTAELPVAWWWELSAEAGRA